MPRICPSGLGVYEDGLDLLRCWFGERIFPGEIWDWELVNLCGEQLNWVF